MSIKVFWSSCCHFLFPLTCVFVRHDQVALDVSRNRIEGTIPNTYKNCASLQVLNVGDNLMSGPIQCLDDFTSLKSLRYLNLEGNRFHGFLSVSLSDLPKLRVLNLSRNQLAGAVPRGLAQVSKSICTFLIQK